MSDLYCLLRYLRIRLLIGITLTMMIGGSIVQAQSADDLAAVAKRYPGIDPKNTYFVAPPNKDADYQPYFKSGTSELVVKPIFTLSGGTQTYCQRHPFETAYLYPRTDYTVWLVENWIFQLQKSGVEGLLTSEPGAYFHQHLPPYLTIDHQVNVIRYAKCDDNHEYVFRNVPVGKYVLYMYHVNFVEESRESYETQTIMTPEGPHNEVLPGHIIGGSHVNDGYINYSQDSIVISAPSTRSILNASIFKTVVHFQEGHD